MIKPLFFKTLAIIFKRCVLALKQLNIPMKINKPKKAVIKCILSTKIDCIMGSFKNKRQSKNEYKSDIWNSVN